MIKNKIKIAIFAISLVAGLYLISASHLSIAASLSSSCGAGEKYFPKSRIESIYKKPVLSETVAITSPGAQSGNCKVYLDLPPTPQNSADFLSKTDNFVASWGTAKSSSDATKLVTEPQNPNNVPNYNKLADLKIGDGGTLWEASSPSSTPASIFFMQIHRGTLILSVVYFNSSNRAKAEELLRGAASTEDESIINTCSESVLKYFPIANYQKFLSVGVKSAEGTTRCNVTLTNGKIISVQVNSYDDANAATETMTPTPSQKVSIGDEAYININGVSRARKGSMVFRLETCCGTANNPSSSQIESFLKYAVDQPTQTTVNPAQTGNWLSRIIDSFKQIISGIFKFFTNIFR